MKKRRKGSALSRTKDQRDALMKTMLVSLVRYQSMKTTLAKAKQLRPYAEKMMTHAKQAVLEPEKKITKVRLLVRSVPEITVKRLLQIAELFKDRQGGYVRIIKLPARRSDMSSMAQIEWVEKLPAEEKSKKEDAKKIDEKKSVKKTSTKKVASSAPKVAKIEEKTVAAVKNKEQKK